jgi:hypothetical protein
MALSFCSRLFKVVQGCSRLFKIVQGSMIKVQEGTAVFCLWGRTFGGLCIVQDCSRFNDQGSKGDGGFLTAQEDYLGAV